MERDESTRDFDNEIERVVLWDGAYADLGTTKIVTVNTKNKGSVVAVYDLERIWNMLTATQLKAAEIDPARDNNLLDAMHNSGDTILGDGDFRVIGA